MILLVNIGPLKNLKSALSVHTHTRPVLGFNWNCTEYADHSLGRADISKILNLSSMNVIYSSIYLGLH